MKRIIQKRSVTATKAPQRSDSDSQIGQVQHQDLKKKEYAPKRVNILKVPSKTEPPPLPRVRLNEHDTAVIPVTPVMVDLTVHYCTDQDIYGYVRCNAGDCTLCRVGRKRLKRFLLPVYVPTQGGASGY